MPFEEGERHRWWQIGTTCARLVYLRKKLVRNQADKVRSRGKYFFWVREICSRVKRKWENQRGGQWIKMLEEKRQGANLYHKHLFKYALAVSFLKWHYALSFHKAHIARCLYVTHSGFNSCYLFWGLWTLSDQDTIYHGKALNSFNQMCFKRRYL